MNHNPKNNHGVAEGKSSAGRLVGPRCDSDLKATGADLADTTAAPGKSAELVSPDHNRECSLKIEGAKEAADPFFSGRKHYAELDGMRGVAILMVLVCHYSQLASARGGLAIGLQSLAGNGDIGVDLFFVLSGFLITGILLDTRGQQNYFRNFYARRFLRIFPLYYGLVCAALIGMATCQLAHHLGLTAIPVARRLWIAMPFLLTYTSNLPFGLDLSIFGPFWTLAVEEQFYLAWPMAVARLGPDRLARACWLLISGALALRVILSWLGGWHEEIYFETLTRMDTLAFGALVALTLRSEKWGDLTKKWAFPAALFFGTVAAASFALTAVAAGRGQFSTSAPERIWYTGILYSIVALFFSALIASTLQSSGTWPRVSARLKGLFSVPALRSIGKYSYGVYAIHYPVMVMSQSLLRHFHSWHAVTTRFLPYVLYVSLNVLLTGTAAFASYHLYEKHFLKLKKYFPERAAASAENAGPRS